MARKLSVSNAGTWKPARNLYGNYNGAWGMAKKGWGVVNGEWRQFWPPSVVTFDTFTVSITDGLIGDTPATFTWDTGWNIPGTVTIQWKSSGSPTFEDWKTGLPMRGTFTEDPLAYGSGTGIPNQYRGVYTLTHTPTDPFPQPVVAYSVTRNVTLMPVTGTMNVTATTGQVSTTSPMTWSFNATKPGTVHLARYGPGLSDWETFATGLPMNGSGTFKLSAHIYDDAGTWYYHAEWWPANAAVNDPGRYYTSNQDSVILTPYGPE